MSRFTSENELQDYLADEISKSDKVRAVSKRLNLGSRRFKRFWEGWEKSLATPSQPEIDLLVITHSRDLFAIEVKYYKLNKRGGINYPYYSGIGEAMALLQLGMDYVGLWQFFDEEISQKDRIRYYFAAKGLTRKLNNPFVFKHIYYLVKSNTIQYISFPFTEPRKGSSFNEVDIYKLFDPTGWDRNTLLHDDRVEKTRNFIKNMLKIPT